ncbi:MAG: type IV pilus twitching motility protein PilT [Planctomycetota bacterium]
MPGAPSIDQLIRQMCDLGASDLHIKVDARPGLRIDGRLRALTAYDPLRREDCEALLDQVVPPSLRQKLSDAGDLDFSYEPPEGGRFRVNALYERGRPGLVMRRIPPEIPSFEELGMPEVCRSLTQRPRGLVLVTGPTGCGKSTTLAAMIDEINRTQEYHIVTVEDPVEFIHHNKRSYVTQREVGRDTRDFAEALRHSFRQDPDVILVGEMRDLETIAIALAAAETGHVVLATLHTTSAPQAIDRIVDVFPAEAQPQIRLQLASTLEGIVTQCLLPRIGGGRVAAHEVLIGTDAVRGCIREAKSHHLVSLIQTGASVGMQSLESSLANLVESGIVSRETAFSRANRPELLETLLTTSGRQPARSASRSPPPSTPRPAAPKPVVKSVRLIDRFK